MIRPYTDHDADIVVSIWRAASELAHPFLSTSFLDAEAANVRNVYPQFAEIWVLENHGTPIGFIALIDAEVGAIFLQPEHHGRGVFKANIIGRAFYDRYGFTQVGEYVHEGSGQETLKLAFMLAES